MTVPSLHDSSAAAWRTQQGAEVIRVVATAVLALQQVNGLTSFELPYPAVAQNALDRLLLSSVLRGVTDLPRSVPDLVAWCHDRPVRDWPLDLPEGRFGVGELLIDPHTSQPTELCREWASDSADGFMADEATRLLGDAARKVYAADVYQALRTFLIKHPFYDSRDRKLLGDNNFVEFGDVLAELYDDMPAQYVREGAVTPCGRCGGLLLPLRDRSWWCESAQCQLLPLSIRPRIALDSPSSVRLLKHALRLRVTEPGRIQLWIAGRLAGVRLPNASANWVELWPGGSDLIRLQLGVNERWSLHVHTTSRAYLLAQWMNSLKPDHGSRQQYVVVSRRGVGGMPEFRRAVETDLIERTAKVFEVVSDSELVDLVRSTLARHEDGSLA